MAGLSVTRPEEGGDGKKDGFTFQTFTDAVGNFFGAGEATADELQADVEDRMRKAAEERKDTPDHNLAPGLPADWDEAAERARAEGREPPERHETREETDDEAKATAPEKKEEPRQESVADLRRQVSRLNERIRAAERAPDELRKGTGVRAEDLPAFDASRDDEDSYRKKLAEHFNAHMEKQRASEAATDRAYRARADQDRLSRSAEAFGQRVAAELPKEQVELMQRTASPFARMEALPDGRQIPIPNPTAREVFRGLQDQPDVALKVMDALSKDQATYDRFMRIPPIPYLRPALQESVDPVALMENLASEEGVAMFEGWIREVEQTGQEPEPARVIAGIMRYDGRDRPRSQPEGKTKMRTETDRPRPDERLGGRRPRRTRDGEDANFDSYSDAAEHAMNRLLGDQERYLRQMDEEEIRRGNLGPRTYQRHGAA